MNSKQHSSFSKLKQAASFNNSVEGNYEANRVLEVSNGESISSNTATRASRHSASSHVPRHATDHGKVVYSDVQVTQVVTSTTNASVRLNRPRTTSLPNRPINEACCNTPDSQDTTSRADAFVGLNRRRRTSLPSTMMLKPEQILQGGRIEVAKREINLDACVPLFTKEAERTDKKRSTTPLAKSEFSGWKREENQGRLGRQRRGSLPALKVDKSDIRDFPSCINSVPGGQNDFLSPPIPRIQSGSLVGKKAEKRQWAKRL